MDTPVVVAIIAALASIAAAVWATFSAAKIERLKGVIAEEQAAKKARLDYVYEARKRLYQEIEPLTFQLYEAADEALHRIRSLARASRSNNIDEWLKGDGYYLRSTLYMIIAPIAILRLFQRKLTDVDLSVEPRLATHYAIGKWLRYSYTDDFEFARGGTHEDEDCQSALIIAYRPNEKDWRTMRKNNEAEYWRQGLPIGVLDELADAMLIKEENSLRLMSFGEFSRSHSEKTLHATYALGYDMLLGFHPRRRPVLWRMLITQAHIFNTLLKYRQENSLDSGELGLWQTLTEEQQKSLDWRTDKTVESADALTIPFEVARNYLRTHRLPNLSVKGDPA